MEKTFTQENYGEKEVVKFKALNLTREREKVPLQIDLKTITSCAIQGILS